MKNNEKWQIIYQNKLFIYEISTLGVLKRTSKSTGKVFKTVGSNCCRNKKYKITSLGYIHRLVAKTFIPNPDNKPQIDHIDGNPENNSLENLRWVTAKENANNPITLQRNRKSHKQYKPKYKHFKDVIWWQQIDDNGNIVKEWETLINAGKSFNVSKVAIYKAYKEQKKSCGFYWKRTIKKTVYFSRKK